jgi:CHAT domain-containing protein
MQAELTYDRNPLLLSGLVLAQANARGPDGILTAEEVAGLDLRGCELAVLSACETGLGKVAGGEGVQGLQKAFQAAGARALLASLWRVDDPATSLLMERFYNGLWSEHLPPTQALRQAQLHVLRHPEEVQRRAEDLEREERRLALQEGKQPTQAKDRSVSRVKDVVKGAGGTATSPVRWWAAFVLSGPPR